MDNLQVTEVKLTYRNKLKASERPKVLSSKESYEILLKAFDADTIELFESMKVILLSNANRVLGIMDVSNGGISQTVVDVRLIMQNALLAKVSGIILAHNHPDSALIPSAMDTAATHRIKNACEVLDIKLLDHIIVTSESYYSFADDGRI